MQKDIVVKLFNETNRVKVKYRDQWGFIIWGIILAIDEKDNALLVDNLANSVKMDSVIEIQSI